MRMLKAIMAGRRWEELTKTEQEECGRVHKAETLADAQAFVDNLNKNVRERHGKD